MPIRKVLIANRGEIACRLLTVALDVVVVEGVATTINFLKSVLRDPVFRDDLSTTSYVENDSYRELA